MNARIALIAGLTALATAAGARAANTSAPAASTAASYTSGQAYAGRFAFIHNCAECHGATLGGHFGPALAGPHSNVPWQTPLAVYTYMTQQMPVGNAGGLPQTQYLAIEAFIMEMNGRRAGTRPLTLAAIKADKLQLDGSK